LIGSFLYSGCRPEQSKQTSKLNILKTSRISITDYNTNIIVCGVKMVSAPSQAAVDQLGNPAWPKVSHQVRTELDVY
jgi:hypothetical protein